MPTTQDMQTCGIGLKKRAIKFRASKYFCHSIKFKINILLNKIFWDIEYYFT